MSITKEATRLAVLEEMAKAEAAKKADAKKEQAPTPDKITNKLTK